MKECDHEMKKLSSRVHFIFNVKVRQALMKTKISISILYKFLISELDIWNHAHLHPWAV